MTQRIELIPAIDIIEGQCVRLTKGDYGQKTVYGSRPAEVARGFERLGFSRLHIVDLDGAKSQHIVNVGVLREITSATSLTVDFGGGIKSEKDIAAAFDNGASMVTVGSVAVTRPDLFLDWLGKYGADRLILGADVRNGKISINGWKEDSEQDLLPFLRQYVERGVKHVLCTGIGKSWPAIRSCTSSPAAVCRATTTSNGSTGPAYRLWCSARHSTKAASTWPDWDSPTTKVQPYKQKTAKTMYRGPAKRIIPCLDVKNGETVKGTNFVDLRSAGDPVALGKAYSAAGADELVFLDITASVEGRKTFTDMVSRVAAELNIPFTVGGGINELADVDRLLHAGADKVSVNSSALRRPALIDEIASHYGSQVCVCAIDARHDEDGWHCYVKGGRERVERGLFDWAREAADRGAGEILFTSMDHDGVKQGFANEALARLADEVPIPVIASGGAGAPEHFRDALTVGKADAALAASVFHFGEIAIPDLKAYLRKEGINVRR